MTGRNAGSLALIVAALAGQAAVQGASAQEVIMLERIGAVRMATPDEARRTATDQGRSVALDRQDRSPLPRASRTAAGIAAAN